MIEFRDLPVYRHKDEILRALENSQIVIIESPTGSGKTTQLPLILKEAGYDARGIIGITQPRRIATLSVCEFIKKQIGDEDSFCAYKMRFIDTSTQKTRIKIMTDGILLQEVKLDPVLSRYSVIMVDEAHERSLNIDFILGLLKQITQIRKDLKVIISSATINTASFSSFFGNAPIVSIDSKPYPVEVRYTPIRFPEGSRDDEGAYFRKIASLVEDAYRRKEGDVLVFLSGEADIKSCMDELESLPIAKNLQLYPLYGRLSKEEQERVFTPTKSGRMKVVVATNIAETSITIDGIRTVIDSGVQKVNFYNQKSYTSSLLPILISKASADQRAGRAGRTSPGICYRLYSSLDYERRPQYTEEEILHSDLAEVLLRMSELGIYDSGSFPFITEPKKSAMLSAEETLILIGAIEKDHHLTEIGRKMIQFPLLPRLSRVIVEAMMNYPDVMENVLIAVAYLSAKTPFVLPQGREAEARERHKLLSDPVYGDFMTILKIYRKYDSIRNEDDRKAFADRYFLDKQTLDEILHIKRQLEVIVSEMGFPISSGSSIPEYMCCLSSGLRQYVCIRRDRFSYRSLTADNILIHPGSSWFRNMPEFILAGEIVRTSRLYARTVSPLRKEWIERIDPGMIGALMGGRRRKSRENDERKDGSGERKLLERYRRKSKGKDIYVVPVEDLERFSIRSSRVSIFLSSGSAVTKSAIKASRLGEIVPLLKTSRLKEIQKIPPSIPEDESAWTARILSDILHPYKGKNSALLFTGLTERNGRYSIQSFSSFFEAVRETAYALSCLEASLHDRSAVKKVSREIVRIGKALEED